MWNLTLFSHFSEKIFSQSQYSEVNNFKIPKNTQEIDFFFLLKFSSERKWLMYNDTYTLDRPSLTLKETDYSVDIVGSI